MKLGALCPAPCLAGAANFEVPLPGATRGALKFGGEDDRDLYAVLLNNHDPRVRCNLNPKVAVVGLSPGATQIDAFIQSYARTGDYGTASIEGAFAGLSSSIIGMLDGLGLSKKLGLTFPSRTLAQHPDIYVTSLVACASLSASGSSDAFDPLRYGMGQRCIADRFVAEMLSPAFSRLQVILILGSHGWKAIQKQRGRDGRTVLRNLQDEGKLVLQLPHPSGQNQEYIGLASLEADEFPELNEYVSRRWNEYRVTPPRPGRAKEIEAKYKSKRTSVWRTIEDLRRSIAQLEPIR